ncbi:MAG: O-antigen ligase family protein [Synergistaceae bacterium]|nr:O-antigen ligase family protein [Synergistaceae bacterium]
MKINKYFLAYCCATLPFLNQNAFLGYFRLTSVVIVLRILVLFVYIFPMYWSLKNKLNQLDTLFFTYELFLMVNTLLQSGFTIDAFDKTGNNIAIFMLYEAGLNTHYKQFIKSQFCTMSLIVYLNLITVIMFPTGLTPCNRVYFLGYYNNFSKYFIMAICMVLLYQLIYKRYFWSSLTVVAMYITAWLVHSGGLMAFLAITGVLLFRYKKSKYLGGYFTWWGFAVMFFVGIIIFNASSLTDYVRIVSQYAFNKGNSFMGRFHLWHLVIDEYIYRKPIFGYGIPSVANFNFGGGFSWAIHTHNLVLETLYQGGVVGLTLFTMLVIMCGKHLNKLKPRCDLYKIIVIGFAGWVIVTLVEPFTHPFMISLFALAFRASKLNRRIFEDIVSPKISVSRVSSLNPEFIS